MSNKVLLKVPPVVRIEELPTRRFLSIAYAGFETSEGPVSCSEMQRPDETKDEFMARFINILSRSFVNSFGVDLEAPQPICLDEN